MKLVKRLVVFAVAIPFSLENVCAFVLEPKSKAQELGETGC